MSDEPSLILVVDDNEMNRDMLSRRLKRLGHNTKVAEDGQKALETIESESFDLILLDIMMPNLNGYDTLERIKSNGATQHIPVIMISAVDDLDSIVRCIELGAEDYLFKPFNPVLLKARIGASLEKNRAKAPSMPNDTHSSEFQELATMIHQGLVDLKNMTDGLNESDKSKLNQLIENAEKLVKSIV